MNQEVVLEVRDIVKDFPGLRANDHISFQLHQGEILTRLGENGAGTSTLMNIIMGIYTPDGGEIFVNGKPVHIGSPRDGAVAKFVFAAAPFLRFEHSILRFESQTSA